MWSQKFRDGIYIPTLLLLVGTFIVKKEWLPYSLLWAVSFGTFKYFNMRTFIPSIGQIGMYYSRLQRNLQSPRRS